jgi:spermidine synthase
MTANSFTRRTLLTVSLFLSLALTSRAQIAPVYEAKSPFVKIDVYDTPDGRRQLIFDNSNAVQSEVNLRDKSELMLSYARHIMAALPLVDNPNRVLVVGLGGGCMQRFIHALLPASQIDTAEIDPVVPEVAKKYFFFQEDDRNKVYIIDGRKFIEQQGQPYDIIFLDAFGPDSIPYTLATQEFMTAVKKRLAAKGIVAANLWYDEPNYSSMLKTYQSVFTEIRVLRCAGSGNQILVGFQEKVDLNAAKWVDKAKAFEKAHPTRLDLPTLIDRGFEAFTRIPANAKILLDKDADKQR